MESSNQHESDLKEVLQQLVELQRQQLAVANQAAQSLADQRQTLRRHRRATWLMIVISLLILCVGVGLMVQIERHASEFYQLWDETFPVDDSTWDEDSGQEQYNETETMPEEDGYLRTI